MYGISTALVQELNKNGVLFQHQLLGMGLGYVDVPLLASALLSETPIWTEDKKLKEAARKLNVSYK
jgi:hypothetical protein